MTQRGEEPADASPEGDEPFTPPGVQTGEGVPDPAVARVPAERGQHRAPDAGPRLPAELRDDGFDPGDTGTWQIRGVVPGAESGRRTTTILRYLLGRLAVDNVRRLTRWAFAVPVVGVLLLIVRPRWVGAAVLVLGLLLVAGRFLAVRALERLSLPGRFRAVEEDLRSAVEAGKANLRGELRRVGLPSRGWAIPLSVVRLSRGTARSAARSRLLEVEVDRVLPRAQLDRALRLLDEAAPPR